MRKSKVAFRDEAEISEAGAAAFVRVFELPDGSLAAAALLTNCRAEPLEFTTVCKPLAPADSARDELRRLLRASVSVKPTVVLLRDGDPAIDALFEDVPIACVRGRPQDESGALITEVRWDSLRPADASPERALVRDMARRKLLLEPFERIAHAFSPENVGQPIALTEPPIGNYLRRSSALDWPADFFPFQLAGVQALVDRPEVLLADDMGLGKTIQAIAATRILFHFRRIDSALFVVPAGLFGQWQSAFREWAPELRVSTVHGQDRSWRWSAAAHVYLTSYETLRFDFTSNPQSPPRRRTWGIALLDEAQKIKNPDTDVSRICKRLPRERSWALTGTPLENRVGDLASICEFLTPDGPGRPSLGKDVDSVLHRHQQVQVRRRKVDVLLDLPPKTIVTIPIELTPAQRNTYSAAEREGVLWLNSLGQSVRITHVLELILRLKQLCNFCTVTRESAKLADLRERMEILKAEQYKVLVFTQFTDERFGARAIANGLRDFQPVLYTGDMRLDQRGAAISQFRAATSGTPLVLSLRAGGQGLNLQEASYVVHFDRWWNPAVEHQAEDRSHRLGQSFPVTVYRYVCQGTIEERIDEIITSKRVLFDELVDGVSVDLSTYLTQDELFGLFGMRPVAKAEVPMAGLKNK